MTIDPITEMTALLKADTEAALASIAQTHAMATRLGFDLNDNSEKRRGPSASGSKGKSKPNLAGWLRRATPDGTLPAPNDILIISKRMVQQGLEGGYIVGTHHPYRATPDGLQFAMANFKGKKVERG
jgi:hypothetical protein